MRPAALLLPLLLAACSSEKAPAPAPTPTRTVAAPRTLVAADFNPETLGAKIEPAKGAAPDFAIMAGGKEIARIASYVACPKAMTTCVPEELPEGTVLTYVHTITPTAAEEGETPKSASPSPSDSATPDTGTPAEVAPIVFRMTRPAPGFTGGLGYSFTEAEAALGAPDPIRITLDQGQLIWRVTAGSGWKPGAPITVWWQTKQKPGAAEAAFQLELDGKTAKAKGLFPAADKAVEPGKAR